MGYTHYWERPKKLAKRRFLAAAAACRTVCEAIPVERGLALGWDSEGDEFNRPPEFGPDAVRFNGEGDDGHETFLVRREDPAGWSFCKTARKPYDAAACACLVVMARHFGRRFRVSSDG